MIKQHSQVGFITNSSTVIYTNATTKTVDAIKTLIDGVLGLANSPLKCDDLYDVQLVDGDVYPTPWSDGELERQHFIQIFEKASGEQVKEFDTVLNSIESEAFNDNF